MYDDEIQADWVKLIQAFEEDFPGDPTYPTFDFNLYPTAQGIQRYPLHMQGQDI